MLVLGQFVDDFDKMQVGGQRLAFAKTFGRSDDFVRRLFVGRLSDTFGFIKKEPIAGSWGFWSGYDQFTKAVLGF
ncbi:hypothetical protein BK675_26490 [Pseudomonas fluorescens]|nr:hypothetical protein BK675_26490 [Pseudomonas fluorescens]